MEYNRKLNTKINKWDRPIKVNCLMSSLRLVSAYFGVIFFSLSHLNLMCLYCLFYILFLTHLLAQPYTQNTLLDFCLALCISSKRACVHTTRFEIVKTISTKEKHCTHSQINEKHAAHNVCALCLYLYFIAHS